MPDPHDAGFIVREVAPETVVYDLRTHRAHCLGRTAAAIWRAPDGRASAAETARLVSETLQEHVDEAGVQLVWRRLRKAGLLGRPAEGDKRQAHTAVSRRRVACSLGAAAGLMVLSIATGAPAQTAATCLANGRPCTRSADCCGSCCSQNAGRCAGGGPCAVP